MANNDKIYVLIKTTIVKDVSFWYREGMCGENALRNFVPPKYYTQTGGANGD